MLPGITSTMKCYRYYKLEVISTREGSLMTLFRLDASIRAEGSASREIADIVEAEWLAAHPGDRIERRHIGVDVLPASAWAHAVAAGQAPPAGRSPEQAAALDAARAAGRAFSLANA
jgi:FMN-dependent NADH-azoreductase